MVVQSTAQSVGVKGEIARLEEMCVAILRRVNEMLLHNEDEEGVEMHAFLFQWILTGQPSSLLEFWPAAATKRVIEQIGGREVLDRLELDPIHIARMAAIMDLNSFLVESFYAERKGMAYFPEAGFLNHSCVPNATYDILPEHVFKESEYYTKEETSQTHKEREEDEEEIDDELMSKSRMAVCGDEEDTKSSVMMKKEGDSICAHRANNNDNGTADASFDELSNSSSPHLKDYSVINHNDTQEKENYFKSLTEYGAPVYLFCCRTTQPIKAGEEIFISYVPPNWSFDSRQYVLHDRYRFWCKCEKCSPKLDQRYSRIPKLFALIVIFTIILQTIVFRIQNNINIEQDEENENAQWRRELSEEAQRKMLQDRGIDVEGVRMETCQVRNKNKRRRGLFEWLEKRKWDDLNKFDGQMMDTTYLEENDMYARKR
ncbi:unnamed protein product [Phytomonas sp. Hart1]|nr:unnamed protein product [Phytomonas sp. Hart1]|eukprot:CCW71910.1 unnamed protein product [Phytomonas sp. isolate Hart1]